MSLLPLLRVRFATPLGRLLQVQGTARTVGNHGHLWLRTQDSGRGVRQMTIGYGIIRSAPPNAGAGGRETFDLNTLLRVVHGRLLGTVPSDPRLRRR